MCDDWLSVFIIKPKPVIAVPAIGLTPILPVMEVTPVVEMPVSDKIVKSAAVLRFTSARLTARLFAAVTGVDDNAGFDDVPVEPSF